MSRTTFDEDWWIESLRVAEWYCFELMLDKWMPPPRTLGAYNSTIPRSCDWESALRTLNRIFSLNSERSVARALSTNFKRWPGLDQFSNLLAFADRSRRMFPKVAITQVERRRKGRAIANAARTIAAELRHPAAASDLRRSRFMLAESEGRVRRLMNLDPLSYENLAVLAESMGELPKDVGNPNAPNAHKLFFLREMTDYLSLESGRPMRSLVLVLGALYFDMSDMTTNDLAKYAQVKKGATSRRISSPHYVL